MAEAVIGRWGKNLAIRLPAHVAKKAGLGEGERVEIVSSSKEVIVRKLPAKLTVESMFSDGLPRTGARSTALPLIGAKIGAASASGNERDRVPA